MKISISLHLFGTFRTSLTSKETFRDYFSGFGTSRDRIVAGKPRICRPQSPQISSVWNCVFFAFLICWPGLRDNLSGKISGKISRKIYPAKFLGAFRTSLDRDWIGNDIDRDFSGLLFAHPGHRKRKTSKSVSFSHRSKPLQNGH